MAWLARVRCPWYGPAPMRTPCRWPWLATLLIAGCTAPPSLRNAGDALPLTPREQRLAECLPEGLSMSSVFRPAPGAATTTVRQKLRELGAYAEDGRVHDRQGKEVYYYRVRQYGTAPSPDQLRAG